MDKAANTGDGFIYGRKTLGTSYLKTCKGCGYQFWGRENAVYHSEKCRRQYDYRRKREREALLKGAGDQLMKLVDHFEKWLPKGTDRVTISKQQAETIAPMLGTYIGSCLDPVENKRYYMITDQLMWRKEGESLLLRRRTATG